MIVVVVVAYFVGKSRNSGIEPAPQEAETGNGSQGGMTNTGFEMEEDRRKHSVHSHHSKSSSSSSSISCSSDDSKLSEHSYHSKSTSSSDDRKHCKHEQR